MADNVTLDPGTGGAVVRTDDDGVAHWPYTKIAFGADNTQTIVGSISSNPFPVALSATDNAVLDTIDSVLDTINAKLVTGTVIGDVNLGATDNAVLDSIDAAVNGTLTVGSHAVTNAGTFAVQISDTSFAVADGSALGEGVLIQGDDGVDRKNINVDPTTGDVQVDVTNTVTVDGSGVTQPISGTVTANLSAIDNAVLDSIDTAVNGTLTIGSHAVTNAGTFATQEDGALLTAAQIIDNTIFADDAAFTLASSSVNMAGAIRDDALSTLTAIEGDAVPLRVNSTGALHVTGGGGGTEYNVDDAGPTVVTMAGVVRDDSLTTLTEVDGDATLLRVNSTGALHVTGGGGGTEYTEDVATANPIVGTATLMERDDALSAVTPIEGDWIGLRGSAEGALWTQDFNSDAILADTTAILADTANMDTNLGTVAGAVSGTEMQVDVITLPASTNTLEVVGDAAHDAAVAGNPVLVGLESRTTAPTAVGDGDVVRAQATSLGKQVTQPYAIPASTWSYASAAAVTDTSDDAAKAAAGAGIRNYITGVQVMNGHDTVGTAVVIKDGSTVIWQGWAEQTGGGCSAHFDPPLRGTANTAVNVANITTGSSTFFNLQGYVSAE